MLGFVQMLASVQEVLTATPWLAVAFAIVGEVLAVVFVLRVLARGGSPASTTLWMAIILATPWVGLVLYYLFPRQIQMRRLRRLQRRQMRRDAREVPAEVAPEAKPARAPRAPTGDDAGPRALRRMLAAAGDDARTDGNAVEWLPSGDDFFAAAAAAIAAAREFVHLEIYIFRPDATGLRFLQLLTEAAQRGVAVRLLYDSLGSWGLKASHLEPLRVAGGRAVAYLPLLWKRRPITINLRNHRKLLVVDGATAFVGGRNIGDEYAKDRYEVRRIWHDAMIAIRGPAVATLHQVFAEDWFNAADEDLAEARWFPPVPAQGEHCVGVVCSGPDRDEQRLWWAIFQAVNGAERSIEISSPYLVPPPTLAFALKVAVARGVRVCIHTNGPETESAVLYHAQRSYYHELLQAGIELHETTSDYNHAKVMVVDERAVVVGSANLDLRSAHLNFEIAVVLPDSPALAREILATLAERRGLGRAVQVQDGRRGHLRRAFDGLCRLVSPLL
jgi:cardiolipin synthase